MRKKTNKKFEILKKLKPTIFKNINENENLIKNKKIILLIIVLVMLALLKQQ